MVGAEEASVKRRRAGSQAGRAHHVSIVRVNKNKVNDIFRSTLPAVFSNSKYETGQGMDVLEKKTRSLNSG
jgi:hypothetical protein